MNFRSVVAGAIRDIAQPRANTFAQLTAHPSIWGVTTSEGIPEDVELRMTRGMVDDGVAADPLYRVTGGVTL